MQDPDNEVYKKFASSTSRNEGSSPIPIFHGSGSNLSNTSSFKNKTLSIKKRKSIKQKSTINELARASKNRRQDRNAMKIIRDKQFKVKDNEQLSSSDLDINDDYTDIQI